MSNTKAFLVLSLMRTGHNTIVNWMFPQWHSVREFHHPVDGWHQKELISSHSGPSMYKNDENADLHIYNLEDFPLSDYMKYDMWSWHQLTDVKDLKIIIILRDPWNWAASCIRSKKHNTEHEEEIVRIGLEYLSERFVPDYDDLGLVGPRISMYREYLQQALGRKHFFGNHSVYCINYNKWFEDKEYRMSISRDLNLNFTDERLQKVSPHGRGSSFDGQMLDGAAQSMDVNKRYLCYMEEPHNEWFLQLIPPDIANMAEEFFGWKIEQ